MKLYLKAVALISVLLVELIRSERWDGKLPTSMVPGNAVPFVNIK